MKLKIKAIAIAALCSAIPFTANATDNAMPSRWSVGITAGGNIGPGENISHGNAAYDNGRIDPMKGWDIGVEGAYRLPMSSKFLFHPSISFSYRHYGDIYGRVLFDGGSMKPIEGTGEINEFRTDITLPLGFSVRLKQTVLEFETGPRLGWYLHQKLKDVSSESGDNGFEKAWCYTTNRYRRFSAQWRFSATCNFLSNRLYAKVAFDMTMTHPVSGIRGRNILSGTLGVNF